MSASGAADISPFKSLQWGLEEKYNIGDPVEILLSLPEAPPHEALERFSAVLRNWLHSSGKHGKVKWNAPTLEVHLTRPPRSADLATALEQAVEELGMQPLKVGYR